MKIVWVIDKVQNIIYRRKARSIYIKLEKLINIIKSTAIAIYNVEMDKQIKKEENKEDTTNKQDIKNEKTMVYFIFYIEEELR